MIGWIAVMLRQHKLRRQHAEAERRIRFIGDEPADAAKIKRALARGQCPACGGNRWYEGPEAPGCQNHYCANPDCTEAWNFCGGFSSLNGFLFVHRIPKPLSLMGRALDDHTP